MTELKKDFEAFLAGLELRFFSPAEISRYAKATRNGVQNDLPPRELWVNLVRPLWVLDQLRESIDKPIRITSSYRSPDYNLAVGSSPGSFHRKASALDFQVIGMSPSEAFDRLNKMRHAGSWTGGLGSYPTFTHIDAGLRRRNATW